MKKNIFIAILTLNVSILLCSLTYAAILNYGKPIDERWKHQQAYRPSPVLFLHGFSSGDAEKTWRDNKVDEKLNEYFKNYLPISPVLISPPPHEQSRYSYLELASFIDFTQTPRSQLIDRNSSVDTYQAGDYYVTTKERFGNNPGWSDKLNNAIQLLRQSYKDKNGNPQKIILVCHSMGGLAVREYLTNTKYSHATNEIEKLILIGVPNFGSRWANLGNGISKSRRVGWFVPYFGWIFSSEINDIDRLVETKMFIDVDGDAVRDMDIDSRFLYTLNGWAQPQGIDYFVIYGVTGQPVVSLICRAIYKGEGDGVVSASSQLGAGKLNLKDSAKVNVGHGDETAAAVSDPDRPLLKFLDHTKPEVTIFSPDPNANPIPEINGTSVNIKGAVSKEYMPADCILKIDRKNEDDGTTKTAKEDKLLYPSDLWNPDDVNSVVAEFDEPITFDKPGTYTISVTVKNPADTSSETKTTKVKVIIRKPVISIQSPTSGQAITDRRPLIKARIYSPDNIDIDLSFIVLKLDGVVVTPTVSPETGGSDITISYTPTNDLSINDPGTSGINEGKHTIIINAKDKASLIADEANMDFEIYPLCPLEIVSRMQAINQRQKIRGINQTIFYNYVPGRTPYNISLGTPDGGNAVPSLDALDNFIFLPEYIIDIRKGIKDMLPYYWNNEKMKFWTIYDLYQSAMGTTGTGAGKDTWTHTSSQMYANGIELIDRSELQKCIEKLDTPAIPMENYRNGSEYYYLEKFSRYNNDYGYYGSYNDCQNAVPSIGIGSARGGCGQSVWRAYHDQQWFISRYYWSFDTSVFSGLSIVSAKLKWRPYNNLTSYRYYRHFTLNCRQAIFDARSQRAPGDWGRGGALVFSRSSSTWDGSTVFLEEIPLSFINTSTSTQFEFTSNRDEARDEPIMPPPVSFWDEGVGSYENAYVYMDENYLITTVRGLKN